MILKKLMNMKGIKLAVSAAAIGAMLMLPVESAYAAALLKQGSRGPEVAKLQQELKNQGFFTFWKITDYFGTYTRDAVIRFQKSRGLTVDGIVGPQTRAALYGTNTATMAAASRGATSQQIRDDIFWLARIIHAESQGESYTGQVAVGNVIMNRLRSSSFPSTIYGVIFEYTNGIPQFSPVQDGTIYNTPSAASMKAAEEAYWGAKPVGGALYFFNPKKAAGTWIVRNKQYVTTIGNHAFYK